MVTPATTPVARRRVEAPLLVAVAGAVALLVLVAAFAPVVVVLGFTRLVGTVVAVVGAWLLVGRAGAIDLSVGTVAGLGALGGGILAGELGIPGLAVVPVAAALGAFGGGISGAVQGRLGRGAGALGTLALGAGVVGVARGIEVTGGRSGYHAVPLLVGGDRTDAATVAVLLGVGVLAGAAVAGSRLAARAAVAVAAPPVAEANGRRPVLDVAALGAAAGALLGVGGLVGAASSGSVSVDGFGVELAALLVLAAVLARAASVRWPAAPAVALAVACGVVVAGPGIVWPLVPLVGTAPPLLVMGPVGLLAVAFLASRPDGGRSVEGVPAASLDSARAPSPVDPTGLVARGLVVPHGTLDLEVRPGEVVALTGPNGVGKSTVLAMLGGQLPDAGATRLTGPGRPAEGTPAPAGPVARARLGVARAWQRPPEVDVEDLARAVDGDHAAGAWAAGVLSSSAATDHGTAADRADDVPAARARAVLVALTARRGGVVLLDEPSALLGDPEAVARWIRGLADGGAAVLVVEHRPEVIAVADRIVTMERP